MKVERGTLLFIVSVRSGGDACNGFADLRGRCAVGSDRGFRALAGFDVWGGRDASNRFAHGSDGSRTGLKLGRAIEEA